MTLDEKRRAYAALSSDAKKELAEMRAFEGSVEAAKLEVENARNEKPPLPDISCKIGGSRYLFELGEITDQDVAANLSKSLRTGESTGGAFSEEEPLIRIVRKKTTSIYQTDGSPIDLLLHYDKQYPYAPGEYLERYGTDIEAALIPNGPFSRIWIYDSWTKSILWQTLSR